MYVQHLLSSLTVTQTHDFFLFVLFATFLWSIYPSIQITFMRPVRGNPNQSFSPCLPKVFGWLTVFRGSATSLDYSLSLISHSGQTALVLANNAACLLTLHIIQPFERTMKIYETSLQVLKKFLLSVTYGIVPCELADIHLFLNYKNGSFIWFNLNLSVTPLHFCRKTLENMSANGIY